MVKRLCITYREAVTPRATPRIGPRTTRSFKNKQTAAGMTAKYSNSAIGWLSGILLATSTALLAPSPGQAQDQEQLLWAGCTITRNAFMNELAAAYEQKTGVAVVLEGGGATRGIRAPSKGEVHVGGACRMSLPHLDQSEFFVTMHPVAWDALTFIVHEDNPVSEISTDQVRRLYLGQITNWKELGGPDAPIHLYATRSKVSGVGYAKRQYIFQDADVDFVSDRFVQGSVHVENNVQKDPLGVGVTGVSSARRLEGVKILALDGVFPTYEAVRDGHYDLYRPLYLNTSSAPTGHVKGLVEFASSEEGRRILREQGTVPYRDALHLMSKMTIYGFGVQ
ncbi:substrate-binding domain-containing protein [Ectothiorhodospiraceae bacterium 2226]|nr:substrate-binding domain-containing protein [Ectothiorhodospiraceae bacterium 2226]